MANDVLRLMVRHSGGKAARFAEKLLGRTTVEGGYLYPTKIFTFAQASPMTTEDIGRQIVRLMNRGPGLLQPSQVTLKDGTFFSGVPFSIQLGSQQKTVVQFIVDQEPAPRVVGIDEIASVV